MLYSIQPIIPLEEDSLVQDSVDYISGRVFDRGFGAELTSEYTLNIDALSITFCMVMEDPDSPSIATLFIEIKTDRISQENINLNAVENISSFIYENLLIASKNWLPSQNLFMRNIKKSLTVLNGESYFWHKY